MWNNARESKPDGDYMVLLCDENGCMYMGYYQDREWNLDDGSEPPSKITHWLDLPPEPNDLHKESSIYPGVEFLKEFMADKIPASDGIDYGILILANGESADSQFFIIGKELKIIKQLIVGAFVHLDNKSRER